MDQQVQLAAELGNSSALAFWIEQVSVCCFISVTLPLAQLLFLGEYEAIHCNTLQHTATHCDTLRHTATHCDTLRHTTTHCNTLRHTTTHYNTNTL